MKRSKGKEGKKQKNRSNALSRQTNKCKKENVYAKFITVKEMS